MHEITINEHGFAEAAFSKKPAWHGLGVVLDRMTSRDALHAAHLDWTVEQRPVYFKVSDDSDEYRYLRNIRVNVRSDNGHVLGVVSRSYKIIQNYEAFDFLDKLVDNHEMEYESAFSLRGGKVVVILAKMPGVYEIAKDDAVLPYILLSLAHDGTGAVRFGPCATRVVCANTHRLALRERHGGKKLIQRISHKGDIHAKLQEARAILALASREFAEYCELGRRLASKTLTVAMWNEFLDRVIPMPETDDSSKEQKIRARRLLDARIKMEQLYKSEPASGTAWGAYCSVVEYIDHMQQGKVKKGESEEEARFLRIASAQKIKDSALEAAMDLAV